MPTLTNLAKFASGGIAGLSAGAIQPMIDVGNWLAGKRTSNQGDIGRELNKLSSRSLPKSVNTTSSLRSQGYTTYGTYIQPGVGEFDLATGRPTTTSPTAPLVPAPSTFASVVAPAERAYKQEVSRVAQLTAQDPDLQRYEAARQADVKAKDFSKSEDIGMEIWARRNPTLAAKVKPGQAGYDVVQRVRQEAAQPGVGAFTATAPIFPGSTNYFSNQYQVKPPGATTADLGAFGVQQPMPLVPQNIGQYSFQGRQPVATPAPATQGYGAVPGFDSTGSFNSTQLSKELLQRYMNALK